METTGMSGVTSEVVVVIGQGYVGLPLAMAAAQSGMRVVGFDTSEARVDQLRAGRSPVEDVSDVTLREAIAMGSYSATSDPDEIRGFDVAVISVPTPLTDGNPDLSHIIAAAELVGTYTERGSCVILESTTYPGTTEEIVGPALEAHSGLKVGSDFFLGYSPERIDPGNRVWRLANTPKVVSGVDGASLERVKAFFDRFIDMTVPVRSTREAELCKLLENTFRHVNIALVNELAIFAHQLDIDVWEAIEAASTKPFGFMKFTPGPGVGGHCLPVDPSYLSWRVRLSLGETFRFVELANDINDHMPGYVVQRVFENLNRRGLSVRGRRILVLGMAYKRNTGDARETPSAPVIERLLSLGAEVRVVDDHVDEKSVPPGVTKVEGTSEEFSGADLVVVLVDHDNINWESVGRHASNVLDTRHVLVGPQVEYL